jgi:CheY-like chemotaxis protein
MSTRILIIEDNRENLDLMTYLLNAFGFGTLTARDGEAGVEIARRDLPDLIICDIHLPKVDGYEVARRLKGHAVMPVRHIPLLAVTALAMVGDRDKVLAAGFDGYLAKPIVPETFVEHVAAFLPEAKRPARPTMAAHGGASAQTPARQKHAIVLVVDDMDVELKLMHSVFDPSGYEVVLAFNIEQALDTARRALPDLIICDVRMPGGGGYELLKAVKADSALCEVPVILITSVAIEERDRQRGLDLGALRYITRPIEPRRLLSEVESCLRQVERK